MKFNEHGEVVYTEAEALALKKTLAKSIQYENLKASFIAMFKIVDATITEDDQPPVEMCEDYLKALKVYNHVTGENHIRTRIEQIVNQHYDIP